MSSVSGHDEPGRSSRKTLSVLFDIWITSSQIPDKSNEGWLKYAISVFYYLRRDMSEIPRSDVAP